MTIKTNKEFFEKKAGKKLNTRKVRRKKIIRTTYENGYVEYEFLGYDKNKNENFNIKYYLEVGKNI